MDAMDGQTEITWTRIASFMRQSTHDTRNGLYAIDLETALLEELVTEGEAQACVQRLRKQSHCMADLMRLLSKLFQDPEPVAAPIPARELLMIWREQLTKLSGGPEVEWVDELGEERVNVDVEMIATVFRELLDNAAAFSPGETMKAAGRGHDGKVVFELHEPKKAAVDTSTWGEPFVTTRRGRYGLGLWTARRLMKANHATIMRRYKPEDGRLTTEIGLAVA